MNWIFKKCIEAHEIELTLRRWDSVSVTPTPPSTPNKTQNIKLYFSVQNYFVHNNQIRSNVKKIMVANPVQNKRLMTCLYEVSAYILMHIFGTVEGRSAYKVNTRTFKSVKLKMCNLQWMKTYMSSKNWSDVEFKRSSNWIQLLMMNE